MLLNFLIPRAITLYINKSLGESLEHYSGSIRSVSIGYLTSSYTINDILVYKKGYREKPLIDISRMKGHINIMTLLSDEIDMNLELSDGFINIIDTKDKEQKQFGYNEESNESWRNSILAIVPVAVNNLEVKEIKINYWVRNKNEWRDVAARVRLLEVGNILKPEKHSENMSPVKLKARLNEVSSVRLNGFINFVDGDFKHDANLILKQIDLKYLNNILMSYVPFDISSGIFELFLDLKGNLKKTQGNVKIFIDDLDIVDNDQVYISTKHFFIEMVGAVLNWLIDVSTEDEIASRVPIKIVNGEIDLDPLEAYLNSLGTNQSDLRERD